MAETIVVDAACYIIWCS